MPSDAQKEFRSGKYVQRVQFIFIHFHFAWLRAPETTLENKVHNIFSKVKAWPFTRIPLPSCRWCHVVDWSALFHVKFLLWMKSTTLLSSLRFALNPILLLNKRSVLSMASMENDMQSHAKIRCKNALICVPADLLCPFSSKVSASSEILTLPSGEESMQRLNTELKHMFKE